MIGIGVALGLSGALVASSLLRTLLYSVTPRDPLTFTAAPLLLFVVAILASFFPVRRAARLDPVVTLRSE